MKQQFSHAFAAAIVESAAQAPILGEPASHRSHIAKDNPGAAIDLWLSIDDQVSQLSDQNFPRRRGRVAGTLELEVHPNYVVILAQSPDTVTALEVLHAAMKYP